ncbi:uncharacterized protein [Nicotiana tomentosiformis]|uniref:uncharacterized protein n=1 Tax=Nicotiana tomentosiformis TaxID=4098 RepID=UPI00051BE70D
MQLVQDYIEESTADNVEPRLMQGMEGEVDEDTLSLCDLPIYSSFDSAEVEEEFNSESQSSNTVSSDYFEFFSEELMTKNTQLPENIIFCGKLIPSRKPNISENPLQNLAKSRPKKHKKWYYHFQCIISLPFYKRNSSSRKRDNGGSYNSGSLSIKEEEEVTTDEISSDQISIIPSPLPSSLSSSSSGRKSRWYLFLFGITKLPTHKMDLSDLRNRTSRRQIQSSISSSSSSSSVTSTTSSLQLTKNGDENDGGRDFWWVVRALSCGGSHHAQAMVNASIGCFNIT